MQKKIFDKIPKNLCTRCGICTGVCPEKNICLDNAGYPIIKKQDCTNCNLCIDVCPGISVNFKELSKKLFSSREKFNPLIGSYSNIFVAHANDPAIRKNAASGGVVTAFLVYLLKNKLIDGAIITRMKPYSTKAEVFIAKDVGDVIHNAGSKYQIIPVGSILRQTKDYKKLAIVGVPCVIHGIRKAQELGLAKNIRYCIGLFCGINMEKCSTELMVKKLHLKKRDIKNIEYRGGKWPGGFLVKLKNNSKKFISKEDYSLLNVLYAPERCLYCIDHANELADISVGDAWYAPDNKGWSSVVFRTKKSKNLLKANIKFKKIPLKKIIESQRYFLFFKKSAFDRIKRLKYKPSYITNTQRYKQGKKQRLFYLMHKLRKPLRFMVSIFPISFTKFISRLMAKDVRKIP